MAGPTPAGGGTVSDLYADEQLNDALVGTETNVVKIIDNTTGVTLLECTVTAARITATGNKFSGSCETATVGGHAAAGDNIEAEILANPENGNGKNNKWRVRFRL